MDMYRLTMKSGSDNYRSCSVRGNMNRLEAWGHLLACDSRLFTTLNSLGLKLRMTWRGSRSGLTLLRPTGGTMSWRLSRIRLTRGICFRGISVIG